MFPQPLIRRALYPVVAELVCSYSDDITLWNLGQTCRNLRVVTGRMLVWRVRLLERKKILSVDGIRLSATFVTRNSRHIKVLDVWSDLAWLCALDLPFMPNVQYVRYFGGTSSPDLPVIWCLCTPFTATAIFRDRIPPSMWSETNHNLIVTIDPDNFGCLSSDVHLPSMKPISHFKDNYQNSYTIVIIPNSSPIASKQVHRTVCCCDIGVGELRRTWQQLITCRCSYNEEQPTALPSIELGPVSPTLQCTLALACARTLVTWDNDSAFTFTIVNLDSAQDPKMPASPDLVLQYTKDFMQQMLLNPAQWSADGSMSLEERLGRISFLSLKEYTARSGHELVEMLVSTQGPVY